jgi:hypothetical protein
MTRGISIQTYPQLRVGFVSLHGLLCGEGIGTADHLDKGMTLLPVHDTGLNLAEARKDASQLLLRATG